MSDLARRYAQAMQQAQALQQQGKKFHYKVKLAEAESIADFINELSWSQATNISDLPVSEEVDHLPNAPAGNTAMPSSLR